MKWMWVCGLCLVGCSLESMGQDGLEDAGSPALEHEEEAGRSTTTTDSQAARSEGAVSESGTEAESNGDAQVEPGRDEDFAATEPATSVSTGMAPPAGSERDPATHEPNDASVSDEMTDDASAPQGSGTDSAEPPSSSTSSTPPAVSQPLPALSIVNPEPDVPNDAGTLSEGDFDAGSSLGDATDSTDAGGIPLPAPGTWHGEVPPGCVVDKRHSEQGCQVFLTCGQVFSYAACDPGDDGLTCGAFRDNVGYTGLPLQSVHDYRLWGLDEGLDACVFLATMTILGGPKVNAVDEPTCGGTTELWATQCGRRDGCTYAFEYASQPVSVWELTGPYTSCVSSGDGVDCTCQLDERGSQDFFQYYETTGVPLDRACDTAAELCATGFGQRRTDDSVCETEADTDGEILCVGSVSCVTELDLPEGGTVLAYPDFFLSCSTTDAMKGEEWDCNCRGDAGFEANYHYGVTAQAPCVEAVGLCDSLDEQTPTAAPSCTSLDSWFEAGECRALMECSAPVDSPVAGTHVANVPARCVTSAEGNWLCGCESAFEAATESYVIDPGDDPDSACLDVRTRCQEHIESAGMAGPSSEQL